MKIFRVIILCFLFLSAAAIPRRFSMKELIIRIKFCQAKVCFIKISLHCIKKFNKLIHIKETHKKMKYLEYDNIKMQRYLKSDSKMSNNEKYLLFKLRTRMIEVKTNFKNKYYDVHCSLGCRNEETQSHLMNCQIIYDNCKALRDNFEIEYEDLFGTIGQQRRAIKLFMEIWKTRESLLI